MKGKNFTEIEKENLVTMYPARTNKEIAKHFNTTANTIEVLAHRLKLRKDKGHISKVRRENVKKRYEIEVKK